MLAGKGSKLAITGGSIVTSGKGANRAFAAGAGAEITLANLRLSA